MRRLLHPSAVPSLVALAAAALFAGPAGAAITSSGNVSPNPAGGAVTGRLTVGSNAAGTVVVEGAGTVLELTRASTTIGDASLLSIASGANATGTAEVRNGAKLTLDGKAAPTVFTGINVGTGGPTSNGRLTIDGAGSLVELSGGQGFVNVGANTAGSVGTLQIIGGGRLAGVGETGLAFGSIGRNGGTGTLTVSGTDAAGNASTLRLAGRSVADSGAFLNIGGQWGSNQPGNGTANILTGGRIEIDTTGVVTNTPTGRPGTYVGVGAGAVGNLTISGKSAVTGVASTLAISGGTGVTPFIGIGHDGATGSATVSDGGRWLISSNHASTSNANGQLVQLNVGTRDANSTNLGTGASIGMLTVTGVGSELALTGVADRYLNVGNGNGAVGTLNVNQGGVVRSLVMLVGNDAGSSGTVNVDGGRIELEGTISAGLAAGSGAGIVVGRGGTGTANFINGAVLQVSSTTASPSVNIGGNITPVGGTGTVNVLSGSQLNLSGPGASLRVGHISTATSAGIGTLNIAGAGSIVQLSGDGARTLIAANTGTLGTVNIGGGTTLAAGSLLGIAHNGTADTGGSGVLVVNGTVSASSIVNGTAGVISGSGTLVGNVINHGTVNPGNSPGTLTIDGSFTNAVGGKLVLEIASDGAGGFVTDRLLFTNGSGLDLTGMSVQFSFLGAADPNAFLRDGLFGTSTFFQQYDTQGQLNGFAASTFTGVQFSATSQAYTISNFSFDAANGAQFMAAAVPEPATWALWLAGAAALGGLAQRRNRATAQFTA